MGEFPSVHSVRGLQSIMAGRSLGRSCPHQGSPGSRMWGQPWIDFKFLRSGLEIAFCQPGSPLEGLPSSQTNRTSGNQVLQAGACEAISGTNHSPRVTRKHTILMTSFPFKPYPVSLLPSGVRHHTYPWWHFGWVTRIANVNFFQLLIAVIDTL